MKSASKILSLLSAILCGVSCLCAFMAFACLGSESVTNDDSTVLQLRPAVQVDGQGVFLNQLFQGAAKLPLLRLCDSPSAGKPLLLKRTELTELARNAGFEPALTNWTGSMAVRVVRRLRNLDEKELLQLLSSTLQKEYVKDQGELELRLSRPWRTTAVPDDPFTFKVLDLPTSGVASFFILRFELETTEGDHIGPWQATLQAKVWRQVWVASSPVKRGELLRSAELTRERRDMLVCREPLAEFAPDDPSLEFVEPVQAGFPILARMLRPRAVVHRGQSLAAMVQDGALMITLKVEALEDGAAGQIIRVRNPLSRRDFHGRVLDGQNILVFL